METFVAEHVLQIHGYTFGMIVVKAETKEEAIKLIKEKFSYVDFYADCAYETDDEECLKCRNYSGSLKREDLDKYLNCRVRKLNDNELVFVAGGE